MAQAEKEYTNGNFDAAVNLLTGRLIRSLLIWTLNFQRPVSTSSRCRDSFYEQLTGRLNRPITEKWWNYSDRSMSCLELLHPAVGILSTSNRY